MSKKLLIVVVLAGVLLISGCVSEVPADQQTSTSQQAYSENVIDDVGNEFVDENETIEIGDII
ncbi:MAG: hypothetical protein J4473_05550 [Candidatus Aenigmarchaeota archaeon]|nr:hypothetical protein [Candidatus Aenigmarchaeota archaeon]